MVCHSIDQVNVLSFQALKRVRGLGARPINISLSASYNSFKPSSGNVAWEPWVRVLLILLIDLFQALKRARGLGAL